MDVEQPALELSGGKPDAMRPPSRAALAYSPRPPSANIDRMGVQRSTLAC